jgi:hypothetical protein
MILLTPCDVNVLYTPASFVFVIGTTTQLSAVGGVRVEYAILFVPEPVATHVPFAKVIPTALLPKMEDVSVIPTHDSAVGGLAREYAKPFVPNPTATHAPFPYAILIPSVCNILPTPLMLVPNGMTTQLDAMGGVIVEYAMLFVPEPTATHVPFA